MIKRALVTGGAGFLGSHLCDRLLSEGFEVVAVDNLITGSLENISHLERNDRFTFSDADIINGIEEEGPLSHVFNAASPASPVHYLNNPIETLLVGSVGTHNALELARQKGARFLMFSTSEVYGDPSVNPQPEEYWGNVSSTGTRSVYDEAKRYAEAATMAYRRTHGVDTAIVRIFNTYGPRMALEDGRVVPNLIAQALRGEPLTVYGTGEQTRSFCYVDDLIDGIFRLAVSEEAGPINIGNPTEMTIRQFAEKINELTGAHSPLVYEPLPTADDPMQRRPDISKATERLGWQPKVGLDEGLRRTIEHFRPRVGTKTLAAAMA